LSASNAIAFCSTASDAVAQNETPAEAEVTPSEPAAPLAAHLPLRRIRNRHGAGPLKQMIAACATLAK
jgi:hypothetical protein